MICSFTVMGFVYGYEVCLRLYGYTVMGFYGYEVMGFCGYKVLRFCGYEVLQL